jgi:ankyrin repeat protein
MEPLPFDAPLEQYQKQAEQLLAGQGSGDAQALEIFHKNHPRFLDSKVVWLPLELPDSAIREAALDLDDARLALARWYNFRDWAALTNYAASVREPGSPVRQFESAVEAVIAGDAAALTSLLNTNPALIHAHSTRVTNFDPPAHRATLLHYIAANGVEGYRQKTPPNAVEIAKLLLTAGAEPDALADMYGGTCTTMSMLVSSSHPARAGVQAALVDVLVDFGASVRPVGDGSWTSPLMTALTFGYRDAAEALVRRGASIDTLAAAAGLGRLKDVERLLPAASSEDRHCALAVAAQIGHAEIVRVLLDAGEDPSRYNPETNHGHSTPLHQAALAGHFEVVQLLTERGASLTMEDKLYHGTPLGWALHAGNTQIADYLRARQPKTE